MKLIISILLLLITTSFSYCQHSDSLQFRNLMKKAQHQETTAILLLTGGGGIMITGVSIAGHRFWDGVNASIEGRQDRAFKTGEILFYGGIICMLGSIPFFLASSHSEKQAAALSLSFNGYPAISLKIKL